MSRDYSESLGDKSVWLFLVLQVAADVDAVVQDVEASLQTLQNIVW